MIILCAVTPGLSGQWFRGGIKRLVVVAVRSGKAHCTIPPGLRVEVMVAYIAVDESGEFLCDDESGNNIALSDGMMNSQSNWVIVRVTYYHRDQLVRLLSLLPMLAMLGMVDFSGLPYPPN